MRSRTFAAAVASIALVALGCAPDSTGAAPAGGATLTSPDCRLAAPPLGALPPAVPAWCNAPGPTTDTAIRGPNSWFDGFGSDAMHARMPSSYLVFENARQASPAASTSVYRTEHILHNGHWMVDIAGHGAPPGVYEGSAADFFTGPNNGGGLMRPDAGFHFENGRLVVEFDVSAGMIAYGDRVWPEVVVTTAPKPSGVETNGWYAAGLFGGSPAIGCAFPSDRLSECRIYDDKTIVAHLNAHDRDGATTAFGGAPTDPLRASAWRLCGPTDPDASCRDHFQLVLERDAVTISVNGIRYMEHRGLPPGARLPDALLHSTVYVYFGSWAYLVDATVARIHWGAIAVNPSSGIMR
ncbi:MAG: hypothetical protein ACYC9W_07490 [Candidatus Limnocylindria bacterium]